MKRITPLLLAILLAGCATGFDRGAIRQRLEGEKLEVTDADIQAALAKKAQLRFPIKVAVHLIAETYRPGESDYYRARSEDWRWSVLDKEKLEEYITPLKQSGLVSDVFVMSDMISTQNDLKSIRLAAAKHGADAVLLVKGIAQVDSYINPLAILNLLILPGYILPSSHRDVLFMMKGAMWDVGNEFLYLSVDAEGDSRTKGPTFTIKDKEAIGVAKEQALKSFASELSKRLSALRRP